MTFDPSKYLSANANLLDDDSQQVSSLSSDDAVEPAFDPSKYLEDNADLTENVAEEASTKEAGTEGNINYIENANYLSEKYGVDSAFVRRAYQLMGKNLPSSDSEGLSTSDIIRSGIGALGKSFGGGIPQMIVRLAEGDEAKREVLELVAQDVLENQSWEDIGTDVVGGLVTGSALTKGAGLAAKAAGASGKGIAAAKTAMGIGEAGTGFAASMPGEELQGGALGLGIAGTLSSLPGVSRTVKKLLSSGDEAADAAKATKGSEDEFIQLLTEDQDAIINVASRAIESKGKEIELIGNLLEDANIKKMMPVLGAADEKTAFKAFRDEINSVDSVKNQMDDLHSLRGFKPTSRNELEEALELKIANAPTDKAREGIEKQRDMILKAFDEAAVADDTFESAAKVASLEMRIKGLKGDPADYLNYQRLRSDILRAAREADPRIKNLDISVPASAKKIQDSIDRSVRQGKIDGDAIRQLYLKDEMIRKVEADSLARKAQFGEDIGDSAKNFIKRWGYTTRYMASDIDSKLNLGLGETVDRLITANNQKTILTAKWGKAADELHDAIVEGNLDAAKIARAMENPDLIADLSTKEREVAANFRRTFNEIRNTSNERFGKNIPEMKDYIPQQALPLRQLVDSMKEQASLVEDVMKQMSVESNTPLAALRRVARKKDGDVEQIKAARLINELNDVVSRLTTVEPETYGDLMTLIKNVDAKKLIKTRANFNAGAAFARLGEIPEWARDYQIDRLLLRYAEDMADSAAMTKAVSEINSKVEVLRAAGMEDSANWFSAYIDNLSGVRHGFRKTVEESDLVAKVADVLGLDDETFKYAIGRMIRTIYPAYLGFNLKALLRDSTQPLYMTTTELAGAGTSYDYASSLTGKAMKNTAKAAFNEAGENYFDHLGKQLRARGLATDTFRGDLREEFAGGIRANMPEAMKKLDGITQKIENWAMHLYSNMDNQNRFITMNIADDMSDDLLRGMRNALDGGTLDDASTQAARFVNGMESGQAEAVKRLLRKAARGSEKDVDRLKHVMASYLINKTQLTYGTVGMNQIGRFLGPLFSMFTTWPSNISSELIYEYSRSGIDAAAIRAGRKFIGPAIATALALKAAEEGLEFDLEDSPRAKQLYSDPSPLWAAFDVVNFKSPPGLEIPARAAAAAMELAKGDTDAAWSKAKKTTEKLFRSHVPLISTMWNTFDRSYELVNDEVAPSKRK